MNHYDVLAQADPKGLIRDAYRIEGIELADCRSIFLDWALSLPDGMEPLVALTHLLERFGQQAPDHPMTRIIRDGMQGTPMRRRRSRGKGRDAS